MQIVFLRNIQWSHKFKNAAEIWNMFLEINRMIHNFATEIITSYNK